MAIKMEREREREREQFFLIVRFLQFVQYSSKIKRCHVVFMLLTG